MHYAGAPSSLVVSRVSTDFCDVCTGFFFFLLFTSPSFTHVAFPPHTSLRPYCESSHVNTHVHTFIQPPFFSCCSECPWITGDLCHRLLPTHCSDFYVLKKKPLGFFFLVPLVSIFQSHQPPCRILDFRSFTQTPPGTSSINRARGQSASKAWQRLKSVTLICFFFIHWLCLTLP